MNQIEYFSELGGWDSLCDCCQMANGIAHQVQQLKVLIDQARQQCENNHDDIVEMLRAQFEKEKNEASFLFHFERLCICLSVSAV